MGTNAGHALSNTVSTPEATRLAPSPTGALHPGNARTFLVNWAMARGRGWRIILRVEDLDTPRVKPGAIDETIGLLAWLGMDWDEGPLIQSAEPAPFEDAMRTLAAGALAYPCELTRAEIENASSAPNEGDHETRFPPELRPEIVAREFVDAGTNWRLVTPPGEVAFDDDFAGHVSADPGASVGDFVVWTKRGAPSYQLAVVVDDARQGVTRVVRGDDLIGSTGRQILLQRALGLPTPRYAHLPLVRGPDGRRLAKRHGDSRLTTYRDRGARPERIIGLCAQWCGLLDERGEMSAPEFLVAFDPGRIPAGDVVFTPEDDAWLAR